MPEETVVSIIATTDVGAGANTEETDQSTSLPKERRKRKQKSTEQRKYLSYYYQQESQFPTKKDRAQICKDLGISMDEINQWFRNRRATERKKAREEEQTLTMVPIESWENIYNGSCSTESRGRPYKKHKKTFSS